MFKPKSIIEEDKLLIPDYDTIAELTTFIQKVNHLLQKKVVMMTLLCVLLYLDGWQCTTYFKEMHDNDVRQRIYDDQREAIEQDMAPFGFVDDGMEDEYFADAQGDVWKVAEYGDKSYMWEFR